MDTIERVARSICREFQGSHWTDSQIDHGWPAFKGPARAAIAAVRDVMVIYRHTDAVNCLDVIVNPRPLDLTPEKADKESR